MHRMKNTKYNIIVLKDDTADHRQFQLSKRTVLFSASALALLLLMVLGFGIYTIKNPAQPSRIVDLEQKIQKLEVANDQYHQASVEMEEKLSVFEEKTVKLAEFVGVEVADEEGVGGPEVLDPELNPYLRYDLGMLNVKAQLLETQFGNLETAFEAQSNLLDSTPSILPARGWMSSGFKYRVDPFTKKRTWHNGLDISCHLATPVYAPAKGIVTFKGYQGGFGNLLEIDHGNGIKTRYGHLQKFKKGLTKGQRVERGDQIAYVGSTGRSTAPHLHYEISKNGKAINPMKYIIRDTQSF